MENLTLLKARLAAIVYLGSKCSSSECRWKNDDGTFGCDDIRILQIDHVKGDGAKDRIGKHSYDILKLIVEIPQDEVKRHYQLLCPNCNWLKRYTNKEYRKQAKYYDINVDNDKTEKHIPQAHAKLLEDILKMMEKK